MYSSGFSNRLEITPVRANRFLSAVCGLWFIAVVGLLVASFAVAPLRVITLTVLSSLWIRRWFRRFESLRSFSCSHNGHWQLTLASGRHVQVELLQAWCTGFATGLTWQGPAGERLHCWLLASDCRPPDWRRLRVRLRFPQSLALT